MFFFDYIEPVYFLIALFIGLVYNYVNVPEEHEVIKYPTPFNVGKLTYIDKAGVCYKYMIDQVECPKDKSKIHTYPYQL